MGITESIWFYAEQRCTAPTRAFVGTELAAWPETHDEEGWWDVVLSTNDSEFEPEAKSDPSAGLWLAGNRRDVYGVELTINERKGA